MEDLDKAIALAARIHLGQKDRYGKPYILHPLRVMMKLETAEEKTVGILHDVVENSDLTLKDLDSQGFNEEIVRAVDCISKRDGEKYEDYIERVKGSPLAVTVKLADLEDNMDLRRISEFDDDTYQRLAKYHRARQILKAFKKDSER